MITQNKKHELRFEISYLVLMAVFLFAWAVIQPLIFSPDELMRYKVVDFIFRHNSLPHGGDPEVLDASWGISYAFYPMLSYMISYVFMKIVSIFTMNSYALVVAARMTEVACGVGSAWLIMKIGKALLPEKEYQRMFLFLSTLLPGAFILFTYVNCDALALFSTSLLIYCWIRGLRDGWTYKTCALVGVGVSICALAYYNGYGIVVATVVVFACSILFCEEKRLNFKKMFQRGFFITAIVLVLAGWWFVRSYLLYDGDFLGLSITTEYAEKYAEEARKPSNSYTFQDNPNANVIDMMFYQTPTMDHNWIMTVYYSFIGSFGYMNLWPPEWIGKAFMLFFLLGVLGAISLSSGLFYLRRNSFSEKRMIGDTQVKVSYHYKSKTWSKDGLFRIGLLLAIIFPNLLNIYYSYTCDFQPQGRYSMEMLVPLMFLITLGYRNLFVCRWKKQRAGKIFCYAVGAAMLIFLIYCYAALVYPGCMAKWPVYYARYAN